MANSKSCKQSKNSRCSSDDYVLGHLQVLLLELLQERFSKSRVDAHWGVTSTRSCFRTKLGESPNCCPTVRVIPFLLVIFTVILTESLSNIFFHAASTSDMPNSINLTQAISFNATIWSNLEKVGETSGDSPELSRFLVTSRCHTVRLNPKNYSRQCKHNEDIWQWILKTYSKYTVPNTIKKVSASIVSCKADKNFPFLQKF